MNLYLLQTSSIGGPYRSTSPDSKSAPTSPGSLAQASPSPVSSPGVIPKPFAYEYAQPNTSQLDHQFKSFTMVNLILFYTRAFEERRVYYNRVNVSTYVCTPKHLNIMALFFT